MSKAPKKTKQPLRNPNTNTTRTPDESEPRQPQRQGVRIGGEDPDLEDRVGRRGSTPGLVPPGTVTNTGDETQPIEQEDEEDEDQDKEDEDYGQERQTDDGGR